VKRKEHITFYAVEVNVDPLTEQYIMFGIVGAIALATAIAMLTSRNAIYSALFLVLTMCSLAVFFLILGGPFIAVVQVSVYAGAIMVLFLFVIMLLGAEHTPGEQHLPWQPAVAILLALLLLGITGFVLWRTAPGWTAGNAASAALPGSVESVGKLLFSSYLFPFEVTSVLLLVAMVGAIVMTRDTK
jgi:NADH-quinone oxidoreductase subunit J